MQIKGIKTEVRQKGKAAAQGWQLEVGLIQGHIAPPTDHAVSVGGLPPAPLIADC